MIQNVLIAIMNLDIEIIPCYVVVPVMDLADEQIIAAMTISISTGTPK